MTTFSRLSALDRLFLDIEDRTVHMHVGGTCIFDSEALRTEGGGIDGDLIRDYIESRLHLMPRFRQRLSHTPVEGHPIWIDDDSFNIRYHVRHTSLPRPGTDRQLKRLVGWINSQQLDRGKPLWEMWVVEGLEGGGFALVNKTHHAMIDGISGADLMPVLLSPDPAVRHATAHRWYPQPPPAAPGLLLDAACHRASAPLRFATRAAGKILRSPRATAEKLADSVLAVGQTLALSATPAMEAPFNRAIGSQRRFDWLELDLAAVKSVKGQLGSTVNDVVLTCVAGAIGRFLTLRGVPLHVQRTGPFRAFCPVNLRAGHEQGTLGNRVSNVLVELPITESDPVRRLHEVARLMKATKSSRQARGTELVEKIAEWTTPRLLSGIVRLSASRHPYNLIVTNVPGPQFPLYLLGARMRAMYPLVPLFSDQGLGIALFSYDGKVFWGFNADRDLVPDLHDFAGAIEESFAELAAAAGSPHAMAQAERGTDTHTAVEPRRDGAGDRATTVVSH